MVSTKTLRISSANRKGTVLINKRRIFRTLVRWADELNIWLESISGGNLKRAVLEAKQDRTTIEELDRTIGKALGIK
jgi:hypothetical protein